MDKHNLGIIAQISAGKDTLAQMVGELIVPKTIQIINFSDWIGEELIKRGRIKTQGNYQLTSRELRQEYGEACLGYEVQKRALHSFADLPILTGIRRAEDITPLRDLPGDLHLLYLTAPAEKRWQWQIARRTRPGEAGKTFEQFMREDADECEVHIRQIGEQLADGHINNNGTLEDLRHRLELFIRDRFRDLLSV